MRAGAQSARVEKFQEPGVFFVDAEDFDGTAHGHFGERHGVSGAAQTRQTAAQRHAVRAGAIGAEALQQKRLDFGRQAVLEPFGGIVGPRPMPGRSRR